MITWPQTLIGCASCSMEFTNILSFLQLQLASLDALVAKGINTMWPLVLELSEKHRPFVRAMRAFLTVVYHPVLLFSDKQTLIWDLQQKVTKRSLAT